MKRTIAAAAAALTIAGAAWFGATPANAAPAPNPSVSIVVNTPKHARTFTTPPGGVLTSVGAITGKVQVWKVGTKVRIRYEGAREAYGVVGSAKGKSLKQIVRILRRDPGADQYGNSLASHL